MDKYLKALKQNVCSICVDSYQEGGNCYLREDANCSLDRYFSLIVETIQKVESGFVS
jgi:hypothetical protein